MERLRAVMASNRERLPLNWTTRGSDRTDPDGPVGESGRWQSDELLRCETADMALVACHPLLMQLAAALIGPSARFGGVGAMCREPVPEPPPSSVPPEYFADNIHWQLWHREAGGHTAPSHPRCIASLQCIFLLDACDERSHCFSYVPESVEAKRALPVEESDDGQLYVKRDTITGSQTMWANEPLVTREGWPLGEGVDAVAPAGALIIQNNRSAPHLAAPARLRALRLRVSGAAMGRGAATSTPGRCAGRPTGRAARCTWATTTATPTTRAPSQCPPTQRRAPSRRRGRSSRACQQTTGGCTRPSSS